MFKFQLCYQPIDITRPHHLLPHLHLQPHSSGLKGEKKKIDQVGPDAEWVNVTVARIHHRAGRGKLGDASEEENPKRTCDVTRRRMESSGRKRERRNWPER